jgi:hypothetical protein
MPAGRTDRPRIGFALGNTGVWPQSRYIAANNQQGHGERGKQAKEERIHGTVEVIIGRWHAS